MTVQLDAVYPNHGVRAHIASRGRHIFCGAWVAMDRATRIPLERAVSLAPTAHPNDPRPDRWSWCSVCLSRAVDMFSLAPTVIDLVVEAASVEPAGLSPA